MYVYSWASTCTFILMLKTSSAVYSNTSPYYVHVLLNSIVIQWWNNYYVKFCTERMHTCRSEESSPTEDPSWHALAIRPTCSYLYKSIYSFSYPLSPKIDVGVRHAFLAASGRQNHKFGGKWSSILQVKLLEAVYINFVLYWYWWKYMRAEIKGGRETTNWFGGAWFATVYKKETLSTKVHLSGIE